MFPFEKGQRWVYVLELEGGNYYVGQSDNVDHRIKKHGTKHGALWTKVYKPVRELERIDAGISTESETLKLENEKTIELMGRYGWHRVRGGEFSSPNEMNIFIQLVAEQDRFSITFPIIEPDKVNPLHILRIRKGMNKSNIKLEILQSLDLKTRSTVLASISGTFNGKTSNITVESLKSLNCTEMCNLWFKKNSNKYNRDDVPFDDILKQLEKLKYDKINRLSKNDVSIGEEK